MSQKQTITIYTEEKHFSYDDVSIDAFLEMVQRNKAAGATMVSIESEYECSDIEVNFYYEREETDEEMATRIKKEADQKAATRAYKLREYERLKQDLGLAE